MTKEQAQQGDMGGFTQRALRVGNPGMPASEWSAYLADCRMMDAIASTDQLISILLGLAVQEEEGNHDDADTV